MEREAIIQAKSLTKTFQTDEVETLALSEIDLVIREGEYVAIVGPSGSGKSTLLGILGLLDTPSRGEYRLHGQSISTLDDRSLTRFRSEHIGFIFQTFNLIGDLSVFDNVALPLVYRGVPKAERRDRVLSALARVEMSHRVKHYPGQLSGGQQQRVAVARALVGNPTLLLADEPTGNLDTANGKVVMNLISQLHAEGATICMVTHDSHFAQRASRRVQLVDGCLVEEAA